VTRCLFADYVQTFQGVAALLAQDDDGGGLSELRQGMEYLRPDSRKACLLAFDDAMAGRPMRACVHFCRLHVGAECLTCDARQAPVQGGEG
jgi:hypothetical protein